MIVFYYANRAEFSILEPVIIEAKASNLDVLAVDLSLEVKNITDDKNLSRVYDFVYQQASELSNITAAVIIGDRREVMFAAMALFVKQVPMIQLAAGDLSEEICLVDDYFRHIITILSDKQVCFTQKSKFCSDKLRAVLNIQADNSVFLPNPTLSNLNLDDCASVEDDFDLVLMHPQSLSVENTEADAREVRQLFKDKKTYIIKGNQDKNHEILDDLWQELSTLENITVHGNLAKNDFISLLSSCSRFITNSSCSFYEAPLFLKEEQIIRVGDRNKSREIAQYTVDDLRSAGEIIKFITGDL